MGNGAALAIQSIVALVASAMGGLLVLFTTVSPQQAQSNFSAWVVALGIRTPSAPPVPTWVIASLVVTAAALATFIFLGKWSARRIDYLEEVLASGLLREPADKA